MSASIFEKALHSLSDSIISGKWNYVRLLGFIQKDPDLIRDSFTFYSAF